MVSESIIVTDASQGEPEGESEGHFYRNFCHRVMETHVEFLRDGLEQHPSEGEQKGTPIFRKEGLQI